MLFIGAYKKKIEMKRRAYLYRQHTELQKIELLFGHTYIGNTTRKKRKIDLRKAYLQKQQNQQWKTLTAASA